MKYRNLKTLIEGHIASLPTEFATWACYPGPVDPQIPTGYVLLTRYGGPGTNTEDLFDGVGYQVKVVGEQYDYDRGEDLAVYIDEFLRSLPSGSYSGVWVTNFRRNGGSPAVLMVDDADRTHFVCSYIVDTESALG